MYREAFEKAINHFAKKSASGTIFGGQTGLARALGRSQSTIATWLTVRNGKVPWEVAIEIEKACKGHVTRAELRPDLFGPRRKK